MKNKASTTTTEERGEQTTEHERTSEQTTERSDFYSEKGVRTDTAIES
jgi:hypothetical protein